MKTSPTSLFMMLTLISPSLSFTCQSSTRRIKLGSISRWQKFSIDRRNRNIDSQLLRRKASVTGRIYEVENDDFRNHPIVQLYTKEGCTLCDKTKEVLQLLRDEQPHSLEAIDITDTDKTDIFDKYKWDIPVLHINGLYWTKHRLTPEEAVQALSRAKEGSFEKQRGEPNAAAMEKKMAERNAQS
mmetsp:Transcript_24556/g.28106  ORF Transcript_24556/g.28106 Transcript_24556/m.28106 type:complete len:185 (+) Transcript_24556:280-834(+)